MDIGSYNALNAERNIAKDELTLMQDMKNFFDSKWQSKVEQITNQFCKEFENYFQSNKWTVRPSESKNVIEFNCGVDSFFLKKIDSYNMIFQTGANVLSHHNFCISQKRNDPNFVDESAFEVDGKILLLTSHGEPDYDGFLKKFDTVEKIKNVEQKIQEYQQRIQKNMNLMDKSTFYIVPTNGALCYSHAIVPTDGTSYYSHAEEYIRSL